MSLISRITTWTVGQILKAADLNGEFNNIVNLFNNLDAGSTTWTNCNSTNSTQTTSTITTATVTTLANQIQKYRRPVLQYNSGTVVNVETGINGTSGQLGIVFPDGTYRTDSTTGRIQCNLAQVAKLTATAQSGLDTGSQTANTWYSFYAVKSQVNTTDIVVVASANFPIQSNFATLNSNFGTNSWVYLGTLANGDNSGSTNVIIKFIMTGNSVRFYNISTATSTPRGLLLASGSGSSVTWSYATGGTVGADVPNHVLVGDIVGTMASGGTLYQLSDSGSNFNFSEVTVGNTNAVIYQTSNIPLTQGLKQTASGGLNQAICLGGYLDQVLGVGSNPIL